MSEQKPQLQDLFIGIAGLIGAGKSTLATALGELTGLPVYYEPVQDNEYLADFYADTAKYCTSVLVELGKPLPASSCANIPERIVCLVPGNVSSST